MTFVLIYILKVSLCVIVFSILFRLLMLRERFFQLSRITFWIGICLCFVLPFVKIHTKSTFSIQTPIYQLEQRFQESKITNEKPILINKDVIGNTGHNELKTHSIHNETSQTKSFSWSVFLILLYVAGFTITIVSFLISLIQLKQLFANNKNILHTNYRLIICKEPIIPFSFFNRIVISENDYKENPDEILLHEEMHIRKKHHIDVLLLQLFVSLQWFNPSAWLLNKDLREIHEYEADEGVIQAGINASKYQLLLIKKAVGERRFNFIVNSFIHSQIKNRITMMLEKKTPAWARLKVLTFVPVVAVALLAFSQPSIEKKIGDVFMQDHPESVVKKVQTDPFFYWNQVQEYCERKGLEPKDLKIPDNGKNDNLVVMMINSRNQVMYRNSKTHRWFKTPEEAKSEVSVQALRTTIVETMKKSNDNSVYFILQNDIASSTNFIVNFINTTLPKAYEEALIEMSTYKNVSVGELKEKYPLLLLYSHPMMYADNANKRVKAKEDNNKVFAIRTSAEKDGKEEMASWKIVCYNGVQSASIRLEILSESHVDEKSLSDSAIIQPSDFALVSVGKDLNKKDIEEVKYILYKRFEVKNACFILGI